MKTENRIRTNKSLISAILLGVTLAGLVYFNFPTPPEVGTLGTIAPPFESTDRSASTRSYPAKAEQAPDAPQPALEPEQRWIDNDGRLTDETARMVKWLDNGNPIEVQVGEGEPVRYGFRSLQVTSDDFKVSSGVESELPAEYKVYSGREFLADGGLGNQASLAVVNGALSMAVTRDGQDFLVETDPETGELYAIRLHGFDDGHSCGASGCSTNHVTCQTSPEDGLAEAIAPQGVGEDQPVRVPVAMAYPGELAVGNAEAPAIASASVDHPYFRHAPEYNASLPDITVLWASDKSQTGASSGLSSKAASYFSIAARVADIYERQLGLRYILQELILVPSDSSEPDPGSSPSLESWRSWLETYRPQPSYYWGHAALWTLVQGSSGGVIGQAWIDGYASPYYGQSIQEFAWGWQVHAHEMGHNVGAEHTSGGLMNPSLISGTEDFFRPVEGKSYTAAKDIHSWMGASMRNFVFGYANMRDPEEIPFGVDDAVSTPAGALLTFDPLANDLNQVTFGAANTLRLVEVGQVYPLAAGTASVVDGLIEFDPAPGFTGQAWLTYTVGGDVGNFGSGWLHSADVVVTVGGDTSSPDSNPEMTIVDDFLISDFSQQVRINPLLNDEGKGRLWPGDVHVVLGPNDNSAESYSDQAFHLVDAQIVSGDGILTFERRYVNRDGVSTRDYTGYFSYIPNGFSGDQVVIEYTVMDANGATGTGRVVIARTASVDVAASSPLITEDSGDVIAYTFERFGNVDLATSETLQFSIDGTASPAGLSPDYALAGQQSFDPLSGTGTVVIPEGAMQSLVYLAVSDDGIQEGTESIILSITETSSLPISSNGATSTVYIQDTSALYGENLDAFGSDSATWNGWSNLTSRRGKSGSDWFDWELASASTATSNTGPSGDHGTGTGNYFLVEATGHTGEFAVLQSPAISVGGYASAELSFWYHMYGSGTGSLSLDLYVDGSLAAEGLWTRTGQQSSNGSDWREAIVDISPYLPASSISFNFRADIGSSDLSDIAIDDISLLAAQQGSPAAPLVLVDPTGCAVESGQSVYLSVIPEGFPAPRVQWLKDGVAIPGATGPAFFIAAVGEPEVGSYQAAVSNDVGATFSSPAEINIGDPPPAGAYLAWIGTEGIPFDQVSHILDPDKDGIPNLLEFAYGLPAMVPDTTALPACNFVSEGGQDYLYFTYRRRSGGSGNTGVDYSVDEITYTIEISSSLLGSWNSGPGLFEVVTVDDTGAGHQVVTVRLPLDGGPAFMRLSVTASYTF